MTSIRLDLPGDGVPPLLVRGLREALEGSGHRVAAGATAPSGQILLWPATGPEASAALALLESESPAALAEVMVSGAAGVATWDVAPQHLPRCLSVIGSGYAVVPAPVARRWARAFLELFQPIAGEEAAWLRGLATGSTVNQLAERSHLSEREMFRRLRKLYRRLGVGGKSEAIARAVELGVLELPARSRGIRAPADDGELPAHDGDLPAHDGNLPAGGVGLSANGTRAPSARRRAASSSSLKRSTPDPSMGAPTDQAEQDT